LSEHPYLYCEHEPVNAVDPSGDAPKWLENWGKQAADWVREYGGAVAKGVTITIGTITGINIAVEIYIVYKDVETSNRMNDMLRRWRSGEATGVPPDPAEVDWGLIDNVRRSHIRDAMRDIGEAAGDAAKQIYQIRPGR
ncbi:MAG: hypothetical protein ACUVR7_13915, partial [Armatimonadota bacterium]